MTMATSYSTQYLAEAAIVLSLLDVATIDKMVNLVCTVRDRGGRIFFLGVGGSASNSSHAVNDFRKIAGIECYAPTDNVAELTARVNDVGWQSVFSDWLRASRLNDNDMVFVLSVGGGDLERNISPNLVLALQYAREVGATICGIAGRDGGYTARVADACVVVPPINPETVTPHTESFQAVIWHLLVSHPCVRAAPTHSAALRGAGPMKWESVGSP